LNFSEEEVNRMTPEEAMMSDFTAPI